MRSISMRLLGKRPFSSLRLSTRLNLWPLPLLLVTNGLLLQWARSNMMPFNFALEANNLGRILELFLALILVNDLGPFLLVGVESKSTFVIGGFLHTQDIVECGLPFMTLFQVFLQRSDLGLELFDFLYIASIKKTTRGSISFIVRAIRQGEQFITRCTNLMHRCITRSST